MPSINAQDGPGGWLVNQGKVSRSVDEQKEASCCWNERIDDEWRNWRCSQGEEGLDGVELFSECVRLVVGREFPVNVSWI